MYAFTFSGLPQLLDIAFDGVAVRSRKVTLVTTYKGDDRSASETNEAAARDKSDKCYNSYMERNPENIEARSPFELRPVFYKLSTVRALGAIAIRSVCS